MTDLSFTRRDFLKLSAAGLLGGLLSEIGLDRALAAGGPSLGRMTLSGIGLYEEPRFKAKKLKVFGRDEIVQISGSVSGDAGSNFNRTWYQLNGEGYTYSGWVQPVERRYQPPAFDVPAAGQLGEVTVPFSITRLAPSYAAKTSF